MRPSPKVTDLRRRVGWREPIGPQSLNGLAIRRRLGRAEWKPPEPYEPDGYTFMRKDGMASIVVSVGPQDDGHDWIHASIARYDRTIPSYDELKLLHRAVFGDAHAYQVFVPKAEHVNIHEFALHLWGRLDGTRALPDFTQGQGSV